MDFVEQLKSSVDIVKVIGEYVRLKRAGSGPRYVGLCPFHTEKTPSFSVHSTHQFYKCFGCDAKGDVINFVMEIERLTFWEALRLLAERNGIPMPRRAEYSDPDTKLRAALFEMHEAAQRLFRAALESEAGAQARAYLERRGLGRAMVDEFALGYAAPGGQWLARRLEQDFSPEQLESSGLALRRADGSGLFDRFRNRLMFPIHNESGKIVAFAGRALEAQEEPKYLNSPETPIYRKSSLLYNLHRAKDSIRRHDRVVLVEGYMDVIGVYSGGVREVVASCGTSLTSGQVRALKRHTENVIVNFDPDAAGAGATERSIQLLLDEEVNIRVLQLEAGLDPDEYIRQRGADAYRERLEKSAWYFHWLADRALARHGRSVPGRLAALEELLPAIQRMPDNLQRVAVANDVAGYVGVEGGLVLDRFRKAALERRSRAPVHAQVSIPPVEKLLLNSLLVSPEACSAVLPQLKALQCAELFVTRRIFSTLLSLWESGERVSFGALEARLAEEDRNLLASAVLADETGGDSDALQQALACLRRLESAQRERERSALRARLKEAERAGDLAEALRLAGELNRLPPA